MPTLTVSRHRADASSAPPSSSERPIVFAVSESTRTELARLIAPDGGCCEPGQVERLRRLVDARGIEPELALLIAAVERYGRVYVRFD